MEEKILVKTNSFLYIMSIQTAIILSLLFLTLSEPARAFILRFSYQKIILILIFFFILLILVSRFILLKINHSLSQKVFLRLQVLCETSIGGYMVFGSMVVSNLILLTGFFTLLVGSIGRDQHSELYRILINSLPIIIYWWVSSIEVFVFLTLVLDWNLNIFDLPEKISNLIKSKKFAIFWIAFVCITSLIHWLILKFDWPVFELIPLWYWQTISKINLSTWLILPLGLLLFTAYFLLVKQKLTKPTQTLMVILIGYLMMLGFAAIEGDPYQVLYDKRNISGHRNYVAVAARNEGGIEFLFEYESALGHDRFFATKPPGVYLLYRSLLGLGSIFSPIETYQQKYDAINHASMLFFPIMALSTIIFVDKITRELTNIKPSGIPGLLMIITPNFLLLVITIDQSIIPFLFMSCLLLGIFALKKNRFWISFLFGVYLYIGLYFSFSLLPMIMIFGLWVIFEIARNWKKYNYPALIRFVISSLIGFAIVLILFYLIFNYSPLLRYQQAITIHELQRHQPVTIKNYLGMYLLNNIEMATWIGFPLALPAILAVMASMVDIIWGRWKPIDSLIIAFAGGYFYVNHFSNTLSEVGRLWIIFVPLICIFTVDFIQRRMRKSHFVLILLLLQLITAFQIVQHIRITWE